MCAAISNSPPSTIAALELEHPSGADGFASARDIADECNAMRAALGVVFDEDDASLVLGHGDLKPTNIVREATKDAPAIQFIDFELAGPNYRG